MILDISDRAFMHIMADEKLALPIRWNGSDFEQTVEELFSYFISKIKEKGCRDSEEQGPSVDTAELQFICRKIVSAIQKYLNGLPIAAYYEFRKAIERLIGKPLKVYEKSATEFITSDHQRDLLCLYRAAHVEDNKPYPRTRIFHTPYNMRSKVSTNRYSIAGYPSLYLGTSLDLCCMEINVDPMRDLTLAGAFKLDREIASANAIIRVIELGIKPQDFRDEENRAQAEFPYETLRKVSKQLLRSRPVKEAYLLWYPLIAACSFIRVNKKDPFAAEYIIPQLLMQWIRYETGAANPDLVNARQQLIGIRYFSCASVRASEMGFNYIFPTSGQRISDDLPFCKVLAKAFYLTEPVYIHEYNSIIECENDLRSGNFQKLIK